VPESQAYMDLLKFEQKLDTTIMRKRLDIQEALKRPIKKKCTLRIFITHQFFITQTSLISEEVGMLLQNSVHSTLSYPSTSGSKGVCNSEMSVTQKCP
jgi:hypothetical protein